MLSKLQKFLTEHEAASSKFSNPDLLLSVIGGFTGFPPSFFRGEKVEMYKVLAYGSLSAKRVLLPEETIHDYIKDKNKPSFISAFKYNEKQYKDFNQVGSISGINDVVGNTLYFDFDSATDLEAAKFDTIGLLHSLIAENIDLECVQLYFSGNKGFMVQVEIDRDLTPEQIKYLCIDYFGKNLKTLDVKIYDAARIIRVPFTKHEKGLYKIPLDISTFQKMSIEEIKKQAKTPATAFYKEYNIVKFNKVWLAGFKKVEAAALKPKALTAIPLKPLNWKACKWNLFQGNFQEGERHHAMMILAATLRGMGNDEISTYHMCKSAIEKQSTRTGTEKFDKDELWNNIIKKSTFGPNWDGGTYSCKTDAWLQSYCKSLGTHGCTEKDKENKTIPITKAFDYFKDYAENIDALTVKTGIPSLDKEIRLTIGMLVGIVAPPSSGKTSVALQMLNSMSKNDTQSVFFSYDMYHSLVFQKLIQKHFNLPSEEIFKRFKAKDETFQAQVTEKLKEEYKNTQFCFETGQTIEEMMRTIDEVQDTTGKKVRFIVVDYNELIISDKSDSTAASAHTIQSLRTIANVYNACVVVLLQPNKLNADPSEEITTYQAAKGSSSIAQAVSVMFSINRPGFDPRNPSNDRFLTIKCLKNRMGNVFSIPQHWEGLTGEIRDLTYEEEKALADLMAKKKADKESQGSWD